MRKPVCIVLAGGKGTRLYPLTKYRSKPAVPLAGKYRLIDIPISNCIHAGFDRIYVVTQYSSESLNRHISTTYRFDLFASGYVDILAAEQTFDDKKWYLGTADAVRHNIQHFCGIQSEDIVILSGDQLYRMDMQDFWKTHQKTKADITIAVKPVSCEHSNQFGILSANKNGEITKFEEKPEYKGKNKKKQVLASMGIYIFKKEVLISLLQENKKMKDFGKEIIPFSLDKHKVVAYRYNNFWEDVGTVKSFYDANLDLTDPSSQFSFYDVNAPIFTHPRFLPGSFIEDVSSTKSIISEGCIVRKATLVHSVVGIRSIIGKNVKIEDTLIMGADYYEDEKMKKENKKLKRPNVGIGEKSIIKKAIIDKNARIGKGVIIENRKDYDSFEGDNYTIVDGIVIIEKNAVIPDGTII